MPLGSGAHPHQLLSEQRALQQNERDPGDGERRDGAGLEARRGDHLVGAGYARVAGTRRRRDLDRVRPAVTGQQREQRPAVANEDERLDDLLELAADDARRVARTVRPFGELLQARVDPSLAQDGCNSLDLLRPRLHQRNRRADFSVVQIATVEKGDEWTTT